MLLLTVVVRGGGNEGVRAGWAGLVGFSKHSDVQAESLAVRRDVWNGC